MQSDDAPITFTPKNEPYLGRELLFHFDQMISCCLEQNAMVAPKTHDMNLNPLQKMACQVIPQSISIALSIRELVRQGYLFGAHVLIRSLTERVMILLYLNIYPEKINLWENGWKHNEAPSLAKMLETVKENTGSNTEMKGWEMTKHLNSLVHGKPDSAPWNIIVLDEGKFGHAPSKILNNPKLCDDLCAETVPFLVMILSMVCAYFPDIEPNQKLKQTSC